MSSNGVPSKTSNPVVKILLPKTFFILTTLRPIKFGRTGVLLANIPTSNPAVQGGDTIFFILVPHGLCNKSHRDIEIGRVSEVLRYIEDQH